MKKSAEDGAARAAAGNEERYRFLYNNTPIPQHSLDHEGRLVSVSNYWLELLKYERHEVIGRLLTDFMSQTSLKRRNENRWSDLLQGEEVRDLPYQFVKKSGEVVDALLSARSELDADGRRSRTLCVLVDVTQRNAAERALTRQKDFSALLVRSSAEAIFAFDRSLKITLWNPAAEVMAGLSAEKVLGRPVLEIAPDMIGVEGRNALKGTLKGVEASIRDEPYRVQQTGREGVIDADYVPLRGDNGEIVGGIAFIRDTTERQIMEEALRQSQKMEAVGQLTGGIAHDFNNLLTVIVGNLDMLEARLGHDASSHRLVTLATQAATRAERLTEQLLVFSRKQRLQPAVIDINQIVIGIEDILRRSLGERIEIRKFLAQDLWPAMADPNQLEASLLNLVLNARDAMPHGGRIVLATNNLVVGPVDAAHYPDIIPGDYVQLSVADTGVGMTPDVLSRAFEPFFTTKDVGKGTGLGLSMVYGFVHQSNGQVRIRSKSDEGTIVEILLPRTAARASPHISGRAKEAPPMRTCTVLVVEDDLDVGTYAVSVLADRGFKALQATRGDLALLILNQHPEIAVLFSDVVMPGALNGVDLARRALELRPDLKIILTSGYSTRLTARDRLPPGVLFLKKPYRPIDLAEKLREAMSEGPVP